MRIELDDQQAERLRRGEGVEVTDPETRRTLVVLEREQYKRLCPGIPSDGRFDHEDEQFRIAPGILRSMEAFWRDLPTLLADRRARGRWVCYHGDERIGIGEYEDLIAECHRRELERNQYHLLVIEPRDAPPWVPEEIEVGGGMMDFIDEEPPGSVDS